MLLSPDLAALMLSGELSGVISWFEDRALVKFIRLVSYRSGRSPPSGVPPLTGTLRGEPSSLVCLGEAQLASVVILPALWCRPPWIQSPVVDLGLKILKGISRNNSW